MSDTIRTFGQAEPGVEYVLRPGAYVLLFDHEGRVAVVRDGDAHYLPGGGLDPGESPEQGAARECREECALEVRIGGYIGTADDLVYSEPERTYFQKRCAYFLGEVVGPIAGIEPEHELLWLPTEEAFGVLTHGSQRWALGRGGAEHGSSLHRCPRCGDAARRGYVEVHTPPLAWFFWGLVLSWELTYTPDSPAFGATDVLESAQRRVTYRCYRCGLLMVTASPWTPV